jgi:hypothetical protein
VVRLCTQSFVYEYQYQYHYDKDCSANFDPRSARGQNREGCGGFEDEGETTRSEGDGFGLEGRIPESVTILVCSDTRENLALYSHQTRCKVGD